MCSYVGAVLKYVWVFSAGTMFIISFEIKLILSVEVGIMVNAILWICLVAGITLVGRSDDMFPILWGLETLIRIAPNDIWDKRGRFDTSPSRH